MPPTTFTVHSSTGREILSEGKEHVIVLLKFQTGIQGNTDPVGQGPEAVDAFRRLRDVARNFLGITLTLPLLSGFK